MKTEPPPPDVCQFCGKEHPRNGVLLWGCVVSWQPFPERCNCPEAVKYWEQYDADQQEAEKAEREENERKAKREKIEKLLGKSGIKKRFRGRTFENFITDTPGRTRAYKIARRYAETFSERYANGDGLYIEGTNGTGKTHLAGAIALHLINKGIPVVCKTADDLLHDIKKAYEDEHTKESAVLDAYKSVDLLIIDDLGKEQCSDWGITNLYTIINDRYEDMKPTIITTNYSTEDLKRALTPKGFDSGKIAAIISRLWETSTVITMAWEDARLTQK